MIGNDCVNNKDGHFLLEWYIGDQVEPPTPDLCDTGHFRIDLQISDCVTYYEIRKN